MRHNQKAIGMPLKVFIATTLGLTTLATPNSAWGLIPYIYEPSKKELNETGISIGKTAAQLIHLGQTKEALRLAEVAVRLNPKDDRLWLVLAEAQIRNGDIGIAIESLNKAKQINPKKAGLWFAEASLVLQQKKPKKAQLLLEQGLSLDPKNANAYFQLGNTQIMQRKLPLALKAFEKATQLKASFWEALNNQGLVLFELGKTKQSITLWRRVLTINKNAEPMLALAAALHKTQQNKNEAIALAKEALTQNPSYISSKHQKEQLWGEKLLEATKELLKHPSLRNTVENALTNSDETSGS